MALPQPCKKNDGHPVWNGYCPSSIGYVILVLEKYVERVDI